MLRPVPGLLGVYLLLGPLTPAFSQSVLQPGTSLHVLSGTTLTLAGQTMLSTTAGSVLTNDGTVMIGEAATMNEATGAAIRGTGSERYARVYGAPLNQVEPGGLRMTVTTSTAPGAVVLERWHMPLTEPGGAESIARWYDWSSAVNAGLDALVLFGYDDQELNGINETDQVLHVRQPSLYWLAVPSGVDAVNDRVTASGLDSLGTLTSFSGALTTGLEAPERPQAPYVFPTIADDRLSIVLPAGMSVRQLELHDASGRLIHATDLSLNGQGASLSVAALEPGLYTITINLRHACRFIRS